MLPGIHFTTVITCFTTLTWGFGFGWLISSAGVNGIDSLLIDFV